jgi:septal ring factor EnvC (AmiA/AmiB activator)
LPRQGGEIFPELYEYTDATRVRYDQVNAMLLNEFLKAHREIEEQEAAIAHLKKELQATVAEQEKTIAELKSGKTRLAATVKEQAAQIQKVSAPLEMTKPG